MNPSDREAEVAQKTYVVNIKPVKMDSRMEVQSDMNPRDTKALFSQSRFMLFGPAGLYDSSLLRIHVILMTHTTRGAPAISSSFSFPLCGFQENAHEETRIQQIGKQIVSFSEYMGIPRLTEEIKRNWLGSIAHFLPNKDNSGTRHVVLLFPCSVPQDTSFYYIYDGEVSEVVASARGHSHWRLIRTSISATHGISSERVEGSWNTESSPPLTGPSLKMRKTGEGENYNYVHQ